MTHKKRVHIQTLRVCNLFKENKCRYKEESCWFKHCEDVTEEEETEDADDQPAQSVFQKVRENLQPPIVEQEEKKKRRWENHI